MSVALSPFSKTRQSKIVDLGGSKAPDLHRRHAALRDPDLIHRSDRVANILEKRKAERDRIVTDILEPGPELNEYQSKIFRNIIRAMPPGTFTESDRPALNAYLDVCWLYRVARKRCKVMGCFSTKPPLRRDMTWDISVMKARKEAMAEMLRLNYHMINHGLRLRAILGQAKVAEKFHFDKLSDMSNEGDLYLEAVQEEAESSRDIIEEIQKAVSNVVAGDVGSD